MVVYALVIYPNFISPTLSTVSQFIANYLRVIFHYGYDPLWYPGHCFNLERADNLFIYRFTTSQLSNLMVLRLSSNFYNYSLENDLFYKLLNLWKLFIGRTLIAILVRVLKTLVHRDSFTNIIPLE